MIKLVNGDCYKEIKSIASKSIDLIVTDPPYKIEGLQTEYGILAKTKLNKYVHQLMASNLDDGINIGLLNEFVRVMKSINLYIWCNKEQIYEYLDFFVKKHNCNFEIIIWHKTNVPPYTSGHYLKDKEYCLLFWDSGAKVKGTYNTLGTVYRSGKNIEDKKYFNHPTIKPLYIIENLIKNSTNIGDTVLDCFMGSGTTGVACRNLDRNFIGIEIDKQYFDIAKRRIETQTQQIELF